MNLKSLSQLGAADPLPLQLGPKVEKPADTATASAAKQVAPGIFQQADGKLFTQLPLPAGVWKAMATSRTSSSAMSSAKREALAFHIGAVFCDPSMRLWEITHHYQTCVILAALDNGQIGHSDVESMSKHWQKMPAGFQHHSGAADGPSPQR